MTRRGAVFLEDTEGMRLLSSTRGRERWEGRAIKQRPPAARGLGDTLLQNPGVLSVKANPVSGRVLVLYTPNTVGLHVESLIRDSLSELWFRNISGNTNSNGASPLVRIIKSSLPERKQLTAPILLSIVGHS